jgi:hypothetical protein
MPLEVGSRWTYELSAGLNNRVDEIRVAHPQIVGAHRGFRLKSSSTTTDLAWGGDQLLCSKLSNTEFFPPIPICAPSGPIEWRGTMRTAGSTQSATAKLLVATAKEKVEGKEVTLTATTLTIKSKGTEHEVLTWFLTGKGIFRQEHRFGGTLASRLTYVSGP